MDPTESGRISHDVFLDAMCKSRDDEKLPREVVLTLLKDVKYQVQVETTDEVKNANHQQPMFDYETYCRDVISTSEKLLNKVKQITIETEHNFILNSKTYKVSRTKISYLNTIICYHIEMIY